MLNSLFIQNIILIDQIKIDFDDGFCVLTGETGAGKSIILDSISLAIGSRSSSKLIKKGQTQAMVIAEFNITNNHNCHSILTEHSLKNINDDDSLILKRIIKENGTSKAFANDIPISTNLLSQIGKSLIEIHGQNDQSFLLNPSFHQQILDQYAGNENLLHQIGNIFSNLQNSKKEIEEILLDQEKNQREKEYLEHIIKEIEELNIYDDEENDLAEKRRFLQNKSKIQTLIEDLSLEITNANSNLFSAGQKFHRKQELLESFFTEEKLLTDVEKNLEEAIIKTDLVKDNLLEMNKFISQESDNLEDIEDRLFSIRTLARKLDKKSDELPNYLDKIKNNLTELTNIETNLSKLELQKIDLEEKFLMLATKLSTIRSEAAIKLSTKIEKELADLKMNNVNFLIEITKLSEDNHNKFGFDKIRFLAKINKNSDFSSIDKIASGGELSRFMLALKKSLSEIKNVPIIIFDEIDSGVGGAVATKIGQKMKSLTTNLQIIAITHQAQIAAFADCHFKIYKKDSDFDTKTIIDKLNKSESVEEIARMLSGENITHEAIEAAKKLCVKP